MNKQTNKIDNKQKDTNTQQQRRDIYIYTDIY